MVAVGNGRLRLEAQRATEQSRAHRWRKIFHGLVAASAGIEQHAKLRRPLIGSWHRRKFPWLAEGAAFLTDKRELVRPARFDIEFVEMPMLSTRVAHATTYRGAINAQCRSNRQRPFERCLDQQTCIACRWQEMADGTAIPRRIRRRCRCGLRKQI